MENYSASTIKLKLVFLNYLEVVTVLGRQKKINSANIPMRFMKNKIAELPLE